MTTTTPAPTPAKKNPLADLLKGFLIGSLSGSIASSVIQPIDTVKVLIQVKKREAGKTAVNLSPFHVAKEVVAKDGVKGLYSGLDAAVMRQFIYCGIRLGIYKYCEDNAKLKTGRNLSFWEKVGYSLFSGAIGSFIANPTDVSLIRFQSDKNLPEAQRRNYKNVIDALTRIAKEEGASGLWRGATPTVFRAMSVNSSQLVSYNEAKEFLLHQMNQKEETNSIRLLSSAISGIAVTILSLPFDNVKTKMMSMKADASGVLPYRGFFDCFAKSIKNEGFPALWVGIGTYYMRIAPHAMITVLTQDLLHDLSKKFVY